MTQKVAPNKKQQIDSIVKRAIDVGVPHFLIAWVDNGITTTHMQEMNMREAFIAVIELFKQLCGAEAAQGTVSAEYKAIIQGLEVDFLKVVQKANADIDALRKRETTKTA